MKLADIVMNFAAQGDVSSEVNQLNKNVLPNNQTLGNNDLQTALSIFFGVIAAVAVLMIVISGFRMIVGEGNPQEVSKARSTILYAVIGLFVSLSAQAIVALVLKS